MHRSSGCQFALSINEVEYVDLSIVRECRELHKETALMQCNTKGERQHTTWRNYADKMKRRGSLNNRN